MKNKLFFCIFLLCGVAVYAQNCDSRLRTARFCKSEGDYEHAVGWYQEVLRYCGDIDGKVNSELNECLSKISNPVTPLDSTSGNLPHGWTISDSRVTFAAEGGKDSHITVSCDVPWSVSGDNLWVKASQEGNSIVFECLPNASKEVRKGIVYVMAFAKEGTYTAEIEVHQEAKGVTSVYMPKTVDDQLLRELKPLVEKGKILFEEGGTTPVFTYKRDDLMRMVELLKKTTDADLMVEIFWCRDRYAMQLVEQRIQNVIDFFAELGLNKKQLSRSVFANTEDDSADSQNACDEAYLRVVVR